MTLSLTAGEWSLWKSVLAEQLFLRNLLLTALEEYVTALSDRAAQLSHLPAAFKCDCTWTENKVYSHRD